ncbi:hypothetical protein TRFO_41310 [Tritrichomonas foetus]|uniref:Uncharacterized protein n=1 Tax=Tritrichomonas foetus TaxID=1144522 RepID=A0A1J4L0P4_9EUKA|nr:hypothetical protein TRFO_41310 [Tritrichomonas foetus]|eukprot:OHT17079.1 hypothetical protein TRFO_41310 [Tritrichomonas foetus]
MNESQLSVSEENKAAYEIKETAMHQVLLMSSRDKMEQTFHNADNYLNYYYGETDNEDSNQNVMISVHEPGHGNTSNAGYSQVLFYN